MIGIINLNGKIKDKNKFKKTIKKIKSIYPDSKVITLSEKPEESINVLRKEHSKYDTILIAKGGTTAINLLEKLNFKIKCKIIGYSDITHLFPRLYQLGARPIMGPTTGYFDIISKNSLKAFDNVLKNHPIKIEVRKINNVKNPNKGTIVCGNDLCLLNLCGTKYSADFKDKILFIENHTSDKKMLLYWLNVYKIKGIFKLIRGLVIGHTNAKANKDIEIFAKKLDIPIFRTNLFCEGKHNICIPYAGKAKFIGNNCIITY